MRRMPSGSIQKPRNGKNREDAAAGQQEPERQSDKDGGRADQPSHSPRQAVGQALLQPLEKSVELLAFDVRRVMPCLTRAASYLQTFNLISYAISKSSWQAPR